MDAARSIDGDAGKQRPTGRCGHRVLPCAIEEHAVSEGMQVDPTLLPAAIRAFVDRIHVRHTYAVFWLRGSQARAIIDTSLGLVPYSAGCIPGHDWDLAYEALRVLPRMVVDEYGLRPEPGAEPRYRGMVGDCLVDVTRICASYTASWRDDSVDAALLRANLTVNSFFVHVETGDVMAAPTALADLRNPYLRTPVPVEQSLTEDPVRVLRDLRDLARLSAVYGRPMLAPDLRSALLAWRSWLPDPLLVRHHGRLRDELAAIGVRGAAALRGYGLDGIVAAVDRELDRAWATQLRYASADWQTITGADLVSTLRRSEALTRWRAQQRRTRPRST
jgi:hypothetical protein